MINPVLVRDREDAVGNISDRNLRAKYTGVCTCDTEVAVDAKSFGWVLNNWSEQGTAIVARRRSVHVGHLNTEDIAGVACFAVTERRYLTADLGDQAIGNE